MTAAPSTGPRSTHIDVLRGIAILLVLFHHFNIAYRLDGTVLSQLFGWGAVRAVARNGNYGVTMFFVISGFLITSNARRRWGALRDVKARAFYGLRVARIVPCMLLLLVAVNLLAWAGVAIFQNRAPAGTTPLPLWLVNLASLTFWMNVVVDKYGWTNYALGVLWSLSVEEVFYLFFPILCALLRRERRLIAFWLAIAVLAPVYRFHRQDDEGGYLYAYFAAFDGIAIGCCTALLADSVVLSARLKTLLSWTVAIAMVFLYLRWPIALSHVLGVTAMALGTAVLLATMSDRSADGGAAWAPARWLPAAFGWFGRRSYELYLFHLIVLGLLRTLFPPALASGGDRMWLLGGYLLLSMALCDAIARCYSEPMNRWLRGRLSVARA